MLTRFDKARRVSADNYRGLFLWIEMQNRNNQVLAGSETDAAVDMDGLYNGRP